MLQHPFEPFFPFKEIREQQRQAIEFVLDAFLNQNKKCCVAELGTGCGKSAMAVCIARYLQAHGGQSMRTGAYILTTQKVLQDQYVKDFGPGVGSSKNLISSIKSASNYVCLHKPEQSCAESRRMLKQLGQKAGKEFFAACKHNCCYANDKQAFLESSIGITNFSYFLTETVYSKKLMPRGLLIVDECHNSQQEISKFVEMSFSERFAKTVLGCPKPKGHTQEAIWEWVTKVYSKRLQSKIRKLKKDIEDSAKETNVDANSELFKQFEMLEKHMNKVVTFIASYSDDNWVVNASKTDEKDPKSGYRFEFKTIDVSEYCNEMMLNYGNKVLMMSATIVDKDSFCRSIGLKTSDVAFISIPSPFPVENRPLHYIPVGNMSMSKIEETLPNMASAISDILDQHPDEKGIIHAVNFRIAKYLHEFVGSKRLLIHDSFNRTEILQYHLESSEPTVLISPSMTEGVDLADDMSRFQIICKVPFPYLGDAVTKKRMQRDKDWYAYQTVKTVIQALGRSIRHEKDHAVSYILDSDWERFYNQHAHMFPQEYAKAFE